MLKRASYGLLAASLLVGTLGGIAAAQTNAPIAAMPDAYVRGAGYIKLPAPTDTANAMPPLGHFSINVFKAGDRLMGAFFFTEVTPWGKRPAVIVSKVIHTLAIEGNTAKIEAEGLLNGAAAKIVLNVLDDLNMDWMSIEAATADGKTYAVKGGVARGNIVVWQRPPVKPAYAKGFGAIRVVNPLLDCVNCWNVGRFQFQAMDSPRGLMGSIAFSEANPRMMGPTVRPIVAIYVPKVMKLEVKGNEAWLAGKGTVNGKEAMVSVHVIDNFKPASGPIILPDPAKRDMFEILAVAPAPTPTSDSEAPEQLLYKAGGPLMEGDIVVGPQISIAL